MTPDIWDDVAEELRTLIRTGRQLAHRQTQITEGVPAALVTLLSVVVRGGPIRLTALAEQQHVDTSVVSRQVAELIERGLVERTCDPQDARAQLVVATEDGHALASQVRRRRAELAAACLSDWDEADVGKLRTLLARLNHDLCQER